MNDFTVKNFTAKTGRFLPLCFSVLLLFFLTASNVFAVPQTDPGTKIENLAHISWQQVGESRSGTSNDVETTTTIFSTDAEIEFLRIVPDEAGGEASTETIQTTQCQNSNGDWQEATEPTNVDGTSVAENVKLDGADAYVIGEPIYFEVKDEDQNRDIEAIDSVIVTVSSDLGDEETITIFETGHNTGVFIGYLQSTEQPSPYVTHDCLLTVTRNTEINLHYTDRFDSSETRVDVALIDPYGIVFNTSNGEPINGVTVTLMNADTGAPASVFAEDGETPWPSTVITGDSSLGLENGEFRFPLVNVGSYYLDIQPGAAYIFPSTVNDAQMPVHSHTGDDYIVVTGSRGEHFAVPYGPPVRVDVPVDPALRDLAVEKSAQREIVQQGDFLQYELQIANQSKSIDAENIYVNDLLPLGLRYQAGSTFVDGARALDPVIAPNGRELTFEIGSLARGASRSIKYVVRISSNAAEGEAINRATAAADEGLQSNIAEAKIKIEPAFQQGKITLVGRVMDTDCTPSDRPARAVEGVRVYLENGRYAVTDKEGKYRFEGVSARTHVVQVDQASLPAKYEPNFCYTDTRYAGTPYSRFVDAQSASLWRADFYVKPKLPIKSSVEIRLRSEVKNRNISYRVNYQVNDVATHNNRFTIMLPQGVEPILDSATIDGESVRIKNRKGVITFNLPKSGAPFSSELRLAVKVEKGACSAGTLETKAMANFATKLRKRNRTPAVSNSISCVEPLTAAPEKYVYRPNFEPLKFEFQTEDLVVLDRMAARLMNRPIESIIIRGHTDSDPISSDYRHLYANNFELSYVRAQVVAHQLARRLGMQHNRIEVVGVGALEPLVPNTTPANKAKNRRVEAVVITRGQNASTQVSLLKNDSGFKGVTVEGPGWAEPIEWQPTLIEQPSIANFNRYWLDEQTVQAEIVLPYEGYNPPGGSIPIAIKHAADLTPKVYLDGKPVSALNYDGRLNGSQSRVTLSRWLGVDVTPGNHQLEVKLMDKNKREVKTLRTEVRRSTAPAYAELVEARSHLIADGARSPVVAIRFTDETGAPLSRGSTGQFDISSGQETLAREKDALTHGVRNAQPVLFKYVVADDSGTAFIRLSPTTAAGHVDFRFKFENRRDQKLTAWLTEPVRDWILVGLAEGSLAERLPKGSLAEADEDDVLSDGRIAFFAKGRVLGSALLTLRYDSSRTESRQFGRDQDIDPDAWYTLYGDQAFTGQDGASQEKLYLRIERGDFHATYGDIETGFDIVELADYQRSLTGLKSELRGQYVSYNLFAAETDSGLVRDQIRGDGTSGFYRLSQIPQTNTETITIETRHRLRSHEVIETKSLRRYTDYQIDYRDGTLFFREPIPVRDAALNPVYVVAQYNVEKHGDKVTTAGGRVVLHNASRRLLLGGTYLHEEDKLQKRSLVAVDGRVQIGKFTELRAEYGQTRSDAGGLNQLASGKVFELLHQGSSVNGSVYFREIQAGYGMGSIAGSENSTRKFGLEGEVKLNDHLSLTAEAADEENLTDGNKHRYAQAGLRVQGNNSHFELGYRNTQDQNAAGEKSNSGQVILGTRQALLANKLHAVASYEKSVSESSATDSFLDRLQVGFELQMSSKIEAFATQEFTKGRDRETRSTKLGIRTAPWTGAEINNYIAQKEAENGDQQLVTGNEISQQVKFENGWWAKLGFDQASKLKGDNGGGLNEETPPSNDPDGDDYKIAYVGVGRKTDRTQWDIRYETHRRGNNRRNVVVSTFSKTLNEGQALDFNLRWLQDKNAEEKNQLLEAQIGWVFRPAESEWFFLNRLDLTREKRIRVGGKTLSTRIVNQFSANWMPNSGNQWSFFAGAKYVQDTIENLIYKGVYSQVSVEYRHSISSRFDLGFQLASHNDWQANNSRYSAGVSVGVSPMQNLWISIGYNWAGFKDGDFDEAAWTGSGAFIRFRYKFDQLSGFQAQTSKTLENQQVDG